MRVVISDTSPLQYLHQADLLHLLPALFGSVIVPAAVAAELAAGSRRGVSLPDPGSLAWVTVRSVRDRPRLPRLRNLGRGEREVLTLGLETPDPLLLLDDREARKCAAEIGLEMLGTLGVIALSKERGAIHAVRPALDRLHTLGFRLGVATRRTVLRSVGEDA